MNPLNHSHPDEIGSPSKAERPKHGQKSKKHRISVKFTGSEALHLTRNLINHTEN